MAANQRATLIPVDRIFTEDEGPAMSGIWTVTFPELMSKGTQMIPELAESRATGAGLYYHEVSRREDGSNVDFTISNAILGTMLFSAVRESDSTTLGFLEDFQRHIRNAKLQDQAFTRRVAHPIIKRNLPVASTDVSGSHVVRAYLGADRAEALIREFLLE